MACGMKKVSYWFLGLLVSYLIFHVLQSRGLGPTWLRWYAKDLIVVPVVFLGAFLAMNEFNKSRHFRRRDVLALVIYTSLLFEWFLPKVGSKYHSDGMDVLMYIIGGLISVCFLPSLNNVNLKIRNVENSLKGSNA